MSTSGKDGRQYGRVLVVVQFLAMGVIFFWPGRSWHQPQWLTDLGRALFFIGLAISVAGMLALGRYLTPFVEPPANAPLRTGGIYAFSRNPIYAGLGVTALGQALAQAQVVVWLALGVLLVVLHFKTALEAVQLQARYGQAYADYAARVPRIIGLPSFSAKEQ